MTNSQPLSIENHQPRLEQRIYMARTIFIQCQNARMGTTYARIGVGVRFVEVAFGNVTNGLFTVPSEQHVSVLCYADHPELGTLHDGTGFDLVELASFVAGLEDIEGLEL